MDINSIIEMIDKVKETSIDDMYRDACDDIIEQLRKMSDWQAIETAPRDGTVILLSNSCGTWAGYYNPIYPSGFRPDNPWSSLMLNHGYITKPLMLIPNYWMPLPTPPSKAL